MRHFGAAILIALTVACGGSTTSPTPSVTTTTIPVNRSPVITNITVTPAFGVSSLTSFSFSASATDPDGDPVSYQWAFSNTAVSGGTAAATLIGDGDVSIRLIVSDARGATATDARSVTLGTMTGRWSFLWNNNACGAVVPPIMTLTQFSAGVVGGTMESPTTWCGVPAGVPGKFDPAAPGAIDSQGNLTNMRLKIEGYLDLFITGKMDSTGRTIAGTSRATNGQVNSILLRKL